MSIAARKLSMGDTIGIICPSHVPDPARHKRSIAVLESLALRLRWRKHIRIPTVIRAEERASDSCYGYG